MVSMGFLSNGELLLVETEDDVHLGTVEVRDEVLVVRSGFVGRPVLVAHEQVLSISPPGDPSA